jgi:hypothetical protein
VAEGQSPSLQKQRRKRQLTPAASFKEVGRRWLSEAGMAESTRSMRKTIFDRDILPAWKNRLLTEITPEDLRTLCYKVKDRGAPATAIHVRDIVKQVYGFAISTARRYATWPTTWPQPRSRPSSRHPFGGRRR